MLTRTDNNGSSFVFDSSSLKPGGFRFRSKIAQEGVSRSSVNRSKTLDRRRKIKRKKERIRNCADKKGDGWIDGWNLERKRNYGEMKNRGG